MVRAGPNQALHLTPAAKPAGAGELGRSAAEGIRVDEVLTELLKRLMDVEEAHGEVGDTEVRWRMDDAVHHGFLIPTPGYRLPDEFAMFSPEGDRAVRDALAWFLPAATAAAAAEGLGTFHERLAAFQNLDVTVGPQRVCYNDFFGWAAPERYDESGNVIRRG